MPQPVADFFESYRAAFERLDAPAVVEHFAFPCLITGDGDPVSVLPIGGRDQGLAVIERLLGTYRTLGVARARLLSLTPTALSPRLALGVVHWALSTGAGETLYDFDAAYTLALIDDRLRITAICHNESPRLRACLARRA